MKTHRFDPTILREYDIRGIVGQTLFAKDANALGRVLAQEILARKVLVEFEDGRRLPVPAAEILTQLGR